MKKTKWIGDVLSRKPGALHRQLDIPQDTRIPRTLLATIVKADTGTVIRNPTRVGKPKYRVTSLMRRRANPVLTARGFKRGRRRRGRIIY
jgi:hypothetical protein